MIVDYKKKNNIYLSNRKLMDKIEDINFKKLSVKEIENLFSEYLLGHTRPTDEIQPELFFRARLIRFDEIEKIKTTESIWYRDWSKSEEIDFKYNRCSDKGQNIFYSSLCIENVVKEIEIIDGGYILIGEFKFKDKNKKLKAQTVNIEKLISTAKDRFKNYKFKKSIDKDFEEFIVSHFKKKIYDYEDYLYKPTIALSNILLKNNEFECLIYPSVANNKNFFNYAIKPDVVDKHLYCRNIYIYKINVMQDVIVLEPYKYDYDLGFNMFSPSFVNIKFNDLVDVNLIYKKD